MIKITLPDGNIKEMKKGSSAMDVALSISEGLARRVLAAEVNGEVWDLNRSIHTDAKSHRHQTNGTQAVRCRIKQNCSIAMPIPPGLSSIPYLTLFLVKNRIA